MLIVITGTPCTGKTTVAKALAKKLGVKYTSVTTLIKSKHLWSKKEKNVLIADLKRLKKSLKGVEGVVESHLLCEISLDADEIFVLRLNPKTLKRRLSKRKYSKAKVEENELAEILDYCAIMSGAHYKSIINVDTTGLSKSQVVAKLLKKIKSKKSDKIDWSSHLF